MNLANNKNDELEKMMENFSKYSGNPNNLRYIKNQTLHKTAFNQLYPNGLYEEMPFYSYQNINSNKTYNNLINGNYNKEYDFYQNQEDFIKIVQDKIFMMKLKEMGTISKECTFSP